MERNRLVNTRYKVCFNIFSWKYKVLLSTIPNFSSLRQVEGPRHLILSSCCSPRDCHSECMKRHSKIQVETCQPFWQTSESHKKMTEWYIHQLPFLTFFVRLMKTELQSAKTQTKHKTVISTTTPGQNMMPHPLYSTCLWELKFGMVDNNAPYFQEIISKQP